MLAFSIDIVFTSMFLTHLSVISSFGIRLSILVSRFIVFDVEVEREEIIVLLMLLLFMDISKYLAFY